MTRMEDVWDTVFHHFPPYRGNAVVLAPRMTCAVRGCRLRLSRQHWTDETGRVRYDWVHGLIHPRYAHRPKPVLNEFCPARLVCDFCSDPDPLWLLSAKEVGYSRHDADGSVRNLHYEDDFSWAACQPCKDAFDAGDVETTLDRSMEHLAEKNPMYGLLMAIGDLTDEPIREQNRQLHQEFLDSRTFHDRMLSDHERGLDFDESILSDPEPDHLKR